MSCSFPWTPAEEDEKKDFTLFFEMTPAPGVVYTNVASFTVDALPALHAPTVTVDASSITNADGFASGRAGLSWDSQYRATEFSVRAWSGSPNLSATAARVEENFTKFHEGVRPVGWIFKVSGSYNNDTTPVQFGANGNWMATYDLGGSISNVTFKVERNGGAADRGSVLHLYASTGSTNKTEWVELASWTDLDLGGDKAISIDASAGYRQLFWQYDKPASNGGNVGVGQVVIEGEGFSTPRFLPGWGPAPVSQGLATSCTVSPTRPGRTNWAEVTVTDGSNTFSKVVEIDVPDANPVTLLILK